MRARRIRLLAITGAIGAALTITVAGSAAIAAGDARGKNTQRVQLSGYQEDPGVISTLGRGQFRLDIDEQQQEITYRLSYTVLTAPLTQAHIHFGGRSQSGGISAFLCSNLDTRPAGVQDCAPAPGTITGTIRPADILGPAGQGIAAGELTELIRAIRAGVAYVNIHSTAYPGGEIRAQLGHHH